jgi:acetylornithine deacetylase/succinyl-diaminopimelate desuccinylase-like protein
MENVTRQAMAYSKSHQQDFINSLIEFLKIKTISSDSRYKNEMVKGAEWIVEYLKKLKVQDIQILETDRNPVVYGYLNQAGPDKPTILIYGHYDVQPPDPIDEWEHEPFEPAIKDGLLYARGSSDMKGEAMVVLSAIESIMASDEMPVNLKFLFEGDEEVGSPSIVAFLEKNKALFKSDFILNLDAGMVAKDKPTIVYGLRGLAYFEITITGPAYDLHSGLFGGVVYNPIHALSKLIAGMKDNNGKILLPGFYDDVLPLEEKERNALNALDNLDEYYIEQTGAKAVFGESGFTNVERIGARPTLDVNGIWGGYTGEGPKTVIPSKAHAKLSMRLVPKQTPARVMQQLSQYMQQNAPAQVQWELKQLASDPACITDMDFYATRCFTKSLEKIMGKAPVFKREGGSIPIVTHFQNILGLESVMSGFSLPEDRVHSPNERFDLELFEKGIEVVIDFFYRISEDCGE